MADLMQLGVLVVPHFDEATANASAKKIGASLSQNISAGMNAASQPLGKITGQSSDFQKSMSAANARVLAFGASAGSIYLVYNAFKKMVSSTIEVEQSLANINTILKLGSSGLNQFSANMFKAAAQTGQTFQTASKVALEFARHGVSATETANRMTAAMQLMRISGLDAADSVNAITAAINAFSKEGLSANDIVSRLTAVDTKFAVSAQDLAKAIGRVGSTATEAGVQFNQLLGLVTAVQTATARGGAVIGNAFKSIFTRLGRPEVINDLEAVGVQTKNAAGQVLPLISILKNLASQYNNLNYAQKSFVTEAVGGVYQVNILKASLNDLGHGFSIYDKAVIAAGQSTGLIEQRMVSLNDTIASKLNTTVLTFTKLVSSLGNVSMGSGAKSQLDSFNSQIQKIADSLDSITEKSDTGDKISKSIGQGFAKGLGDIISGPGIQIAAALIAKITKGFGAFAIASGKTELGYNEPAEKQKMIQQGIGQVLSQNNGLMEKYIALLNEANSIGGAKGVQLKRQALTELSSGVMQRVYEGNVNQAFSANIVSAVGKEIGANISVTPAGGFSVPNAAMPDPSEPYHIWDTQNQNIVKRGVYANKRGLQASAERKNQNYGAYRYTTKLGSDIELSSYLAMSKNPNAQIVVGDKRLAGKEILEWFYEREAVRKALIRENSSSATIGFSPEAVSTNNPLGAMVYDKSYQNSPQDAINQHATIGQTDVKNMGGGFVPNFGITDSLILGSLQGVLGNKMGGILNSLSFGYEKQIELIRKTNEQFAILQKNIQVEGSTKYNGQEYNDVDKLADAIKSKNSSFSKDPTVQAAQNAEYQNYRQRVSGISGKISSGSIYGMIAAPMAIEQAASFSKNFGAVDASKGLEEFSNGIVTASQLLLTFPNKLGVITAAGVAANSLSNALSITASKFGTFERAYDLASTRAENLSSAGNDVLDSFDKLKAAANDTAVTLDEYQSLQSKYSKSLIALAGINPDASGKGGGAEIVQKLEGAGTSEEKRNILSQAINTQSADKSETEIRMNLAQMVANNSIAGHSFAESRAGGIFATDTGLFGGTNPTDILEKQNTLSQAAVAIGQRVMDSDLMPQGFSDRMKKGALNDNDISSYMSEAVKNPIYTDLGTQSAAQLFKQLSYEINKFKIPKGVGVDEWDRHIKALNEINIQEMAIRQKYNQELQNVISKGALISNFNLASGVAGAESTYRTASLATYKGGKQNELSSLTTSDSSTIQQRYALKIQDLNDQFQRDSSLNNIAGKKSISESLQKVTQEFIRPTLTNSTDASGLATLLPDKQRQNEYLASRLSEFSKNPQNILSGVTDKDSFIKNFLGAGATVGETGNEMFKPVQFSGLQSSLSSALSSKTEDIGNILLESKTIAEKNAEEQTKALYDLLAEIKTARFSELADGIKGIDELARGGARSARIELRRDEYTMTHSRSTIRRGEAARDLLNFIPSDERDYNNPQIRGLYDTAQAGSRAAYNYIYAGSGLQQFANSDERSFDRTFGKYKGVNTPSLDINSPIPGGQSGLDISPLDTSVKRASGDLDIFSHSLETLGTNFKTFQDLIQKSEDAKTAESNKYTPNGTDNSTPPPTPPPAKWYQTLGMNAIPSGGAMLSAGALILSIGAMFKGRGGGEATKELVTEFKGLKEAIINPKTAQAGESAIAAGEKAASKVAQEIKGNFGIPTLEKQSNFAINSNSKLAAPTGTAFSPIEDAKAELKTLASNKAIYEKRMQDAYDKILKVRQERMPEYIKQTYLGGQEKGLLPEHYDILAGQVNTSSLKGGKTALREYTRARNLLLGNSAREGVLNDRISTINSQESQKIGKSLKVEPLRYGSGTAYDTEIARRVSLRDSLAKNVSSTSSGVKEAFSLKFGSLADSLNPLSGWKNAGKLGKFARVGGTALGAVGVGFAAKESYDDFKQGHYSEGIGNMGLGLLGVSKSPLSYVAMAGRYLVDKNSERMQYGSQIETEEVRGKRLDDRMNFIKKYGDKYRTSTDEVFNQNYEHATGMHSKSARIEKALTDKDANNYFNQTKSNIFQNRILPEHTINRNGYLYGYKGGLGNQSYSALGKDSPELEAKYQKDREAQRQMIERNLTKSSAGLAYLKYNDDLASKSASSLTQKQFGNQTPQSILDKQNLTATKDNRQDELQKNQEGFKNLQTGAVDLMTAAKLMTAAAEILSKGLAPINITVTPNAAGILDLIKSVTSNQPLPAKVQ